MSARGWLPTRADLDAATAATAAAIADPSASLAESSGPPSWKRRSSPPTCNGQRPRPSLRRASDENRSPRPGAHDGRAVAHHLRHPRPHGVPARAWLILAAEVLVAAVLLAGRPDPAPVLLVAFPASGLVFAMSAASAHAGLDIALARRPRSPREVIHAILDGPPCPG